MATFRKRGNKWQAQVRRSGHSPVSRSFLHRTDAERWARSKELDLDRTLLPSDPRILSRFTLGDLVRRYMDTVTPRKRRHEIERIELKAFLRYPICSKKLSELRTADFAEYRDIRLKQIKPASLKRSLAPIRHLFRIAGEEWGLPINESPLAKLRLNAPDKPRDRRLRAGEYEKLLVAAQATRNEHILPIIQLALETGMRRGELLAIERHDIDLDQRLLRIPQTKNGHSRMIPLSLKAMALLRGYEGVEGKLFPLSGNAFKLCWTRLRKRAGLPDIRFHDLRHEAISCFFEKGLTIPEAALISGHRDARMLFRYSHALRENALIKLDSNIS